MKLNKLQQTLLLDAIQFLRVTRLEVRQECVVHSIDNTAPPSSHWGIPQLAELQTQIGKLEVTEMPHVCPECCDSAINRGHALPGEICEGCAFLQAGLK